MDTDAFVRASLPSPPARVLEVGCGGGRLARALDSAGHRVVAIDPRAPDGPIFRRTTLEDFGEPGSFDAVVAVYSLHHVHDLSRAVDRIADLLDPDGVVVLEEFGWDLVDERTAGWYARQSPGSDPGRFLADWQSEHDGLHTRDAMRSALDARLRERSFEPRPYLARCLERPDLADAERAAIADGEIAAVGFRYVGEAPP